MNVPKERILIENDKDNPDSEMSRTHTVLNDVFKDLPKNHLGFFNANTQQVVDLGDISSATEMFGSSILEDSQGIDDEGRVDHNFKIRSIYDMFNAEASLNFQQSLKSEIPVGYGYSFKYEQIPSFSKFNNELPIELWASWAKFVNFDHALRQSFHSLYGIGNLWVEKGYDKYGLSENNWGIRRLVVRSPDTMFNVIDKSGRILYFIQDLNPNSDRVLGKGMVVREDKVKTTEFTDKFDNKDEIIRIARHRMLYMNYNAYYDDTVYGYGNFVPLISATRAKIGIQKRVLRMVENSATSFMVFKYGTEEHMVSGNTAQAVFKNVKASSQLRFVLLPWFFDVQEKELGKNLPNVEPYLNYFNNQLMNGAGIPPFLYGMGGSTEGSKEQMEILTRQLMYMQKVIGNEYRRQVFPEVMTANRHIGYESVLTKNGIIDEELRTIATLYPLITPKQWSLVPYLKWHVMETVADRRLRHQAYSQEGTMSEEEIREESGYTGEVSIEKLPKKLFLEYQKMQQEVVLMKQQLDAQKSIAKENAKQSAKQNGNTSSSSKQSQ